MPWEMAIPHPATRVHLLTLTALCPSLVSGERGTGAAQKGNSYTLNLIVIPTILERTIRRTRQLIRLIHTSGHCASFLRGRHPKTVMFRYYSQRSCKRVIQI